MKKILCSFAIIAIFLSAVFATDETIIITSKDDLINLTKQVEQSGTEYYDNSKTYTVKFVSKDIDCDTINRYNLFFEKYSTYVDLSECTQLTSIGRYTFFACYKLINITLPNSVTSIEGLAFASCKSLQSITLPNSVTSIGSSAFTSCESLQSITLPNSVTSIGSNAFKLCDNLKSITIPSSVTNIDESAFSECRSLVEINVEPSNPAYSSENGVLFDKNKTILICYPNGKADIKYTMPNSVTETARYAFYQCKNLENIVLSDSLTKVLSCTFQECTSLKEIYFPKSLIFIGTMVFDGCTNLKMVSFRDFEAIWTYKAPSYFSDLNIDPVNVEVNVPDVLAYWLTKTDIRYTEWYKQQ